MKKYILPLLLVLALSSCVRLDSLMYNTDATIKEYKLDNYKGEVDFILDQSYAIPNDKVRTFTLSVSNNDIYAIYIGDERKISTDTVIFYCHGNKDHMDFYWQRAKLLANIGGKMRYGVMMIDYKGYGLSEGQSTEDGLVEDVDAALQWLKANGLTDSRLIMYGFSLGTSAAIHAAGEKLTLVPEKLIAEAPFASIDVMASDGALLDMPGTYFVSDKFANAENIKKVKQPFFWMHGTADDFLSIKTHGEVVYKNYNGIYSQADRVEGAGHATIPQTVGFVKYIEQLEAFITKKI